VDDLQSEKEQIDEMRAWWTEYGRYVIAGVVIAVGMLFGYNQYESSKLNAEVEASVLFETLAEHVNDGDLEDAEIVAVELVTDYANTAYAAQSRLAMARLYMDKNRDQDAADSLRELLEMRGNRELRNIGRVRLARVLLYQDKAQEAVDLLANEEDEAFAGLYADALGDAYAALGRIEAAADAYRTALADTSQTVNRAVVQMKLMDLPDASAEVSVESAADPVDEAIDEPAGGSEAGEVATDTAQEQEGGESE
jgi:predicted negative regulator of RcsB-dependent stress response